MGAIIKNLQTCKLQFSALRVFKTLEITSNVEFRSSEAGANGFSNTFQEDLQVYLKRTSTWMFYFRINFERQNNILMPNSIPMLMAIFPNDSGKL